VSAPPATGGPGPPTRNPWWIPPFLGRVPDVPPAQIRMLGVIALALLFENYDQAMLTAALKQIAESFAVRESDLGGLMAWVQAGALPAFAVIPFADRVGRRRLFLFSLVMLSLATMASAFAPTVQVFIGLQMVSRTFMLTCAATAFVIVTEELPAAHRGWGIGMLGALATFGYGLGLLLFAAINVLPYGWRAMYVVGMVPLLLLPRFRRNVVETRRFAQHQERRGGAAPASWWRPLFQLTRVYPGRTLAVAVIGVLAAAGHAVGFSFAAYYVQTTHGWSPGEYTAMAFLAGLVGIIGHPWTGRVADQRGRRLVGFGVLGAYPLLVLGFYHGPGWSLPILWVPLVFTLTGGSTILRALSTELFPTSFRGTASGFLMLAEALGRMGGLALLDWGTPEGSSNIPMIGAIAFTALIAGVIVLFVPETGRRELEEVSAEQGGPLPDPAPPAFRPASAPLDRAP
jgi:MFS family permease